MGRRAIEAKRKPARRKAAVAVKPRSRPAARPRKPVVSASQKIAIQYARQLADDKCDDVVLLDLRGLSAICDFFLIGTGTSDRQMRAVAAHIADLARSRGERMFTSAGFEDAAWIVLDYVNIVIHLFSREARGYYELEQLWGDAPRIEWNTAPQ